MQTLVSVVCLEIEKKTTHAQKQLVYLLQLHWSDGRVSEVEKPHSAFVDLRTVLKKNYYSDQRNVHIPEVPALKKFEIGTATKKDEKKKKSVEEFCMQLSKLPDVVGKVNPVREFFAAYDDTGVYKLATDFEDDGAYSNAELMEHEAKENAQKGKPSQDKSNGIKGKDKKKTQENGQERSDGKQMQGKTNIPPQKEEVPTNMSTLYAEVNKPKAVNYVEVDVSDTGKSDRLTSALSPPETLYAEIGPSHPERPTTTPPAIPPPKGGVKTPAQNNHKHSPVEPNRKADPIPPPRSSQHPEKLNSKPSRPLREVLVPKEEYSYQEEEEKGNTRQDSEQTYFSHQYQNFSMTSLNEKKLYIVTESFVPNTAFSQYLAVENGDIVEVQAVSGDKFFCTLHATHFRSMEGWLPGNILQPCNSSALSNSKSTSALNSSPKVLARKISPDGSRLPHAGHSEESFVPITPIPPKPSTPSTSSHSSEGHSEPQQNSIWSAVKVMAIADYKSEDDSILSFEKGLVGELICGEDPDWWCIRIGFINGWVPAQYWQLVQETRESMSFSQMSIADAPYFVGSLSRGECEEMLMKYGLHLDFVVRESSNLVGQFALSVRHNDHVHHFPIVLTEDNKYYIGKHRFKTIDNVISYYQRNDVFVDEDGSAVRLRNPFVLPSKGNRCAEVDI